MRDIDFCKASWICAEESLCSKSVAIWTAEVQNVELWVTSSDLTFSLNRFWEQSNLSKVHLSRGIKSCDPWVLFNGPTKAQFNKTKTKTGFTTTSLHYLDVAELKVLPQRNRAEKSGSGAPAYTPLRTNGLGRAYCPQELRPSHIQSWERTNIQRYITF